MNKLEGLLAETKLKDLLAGKADEESKKKVMIVLAIIGAVVAVAVIAYVVYRFAAPDYLEDFEEDFEEDFDDYFSEEEQV
ncbi:MAG: hypothetical protein FWE25_01570 [Lachnospiraceae bacterium]|nr:hypothetical protein [Lachnospiraceae bacterium]